MTEEERLNPEESNVLEEIGLLTKYKRKPHHSSENKSKGNTYFYEIENENIVFLRLSGCGLETVPESISKLKSLKFLKLDGNKLTNLPGSIGELKSLEKLDISNNNLATLPNSIGDLESLLELNLEKNKGIHLPNSLANLKSIEKMILNSVDLRILPECITQLDSLKYLELEWNKFESLPESLGNLKSLEKLLISYNPLKTVPRSIGNLTSLQELYIGQSELSTLPESIGTLVSLKTLMLFMNHIITIPDSIGDLKSLEILNLNRNLLISLPESIGNLKNLQELWLANTKLENLPESIGNLNSLRIFNSNYSQLKSLPRTMGKLEDLVDLSLIKNQFTTIPKSIWSLKKLKKLELNNNPWDEESYEIINKPIPEILEYCRKNETINIFLSHAVADFDYFKIKKISEFLSEQNEIYRTYYCEEDLIGGIDDFMNEKVPDSQLLLFFASQKSVFNSKDCAHELELARKHGIQIIPIKGMDINWEDLSKIGLSRDLGFEFAEDDIPTFCQNLFAYIKKFKGEVNLFEAEEAKIGRQILNYKNTLEKFIESPELKEIVRVNLEQLEEIFNKLNEHVYTPIQYLQKVSKILFNNIN